MKKQISPNIQAHRLQKMACVVLLVTVCAISFALAQRNATEQTVAELSSASRGLMEVGNALPATIIVVTNTNDSGPGSLRDALAVANDGDTIDATGVSGTILLTSGELQITHNVTINGPGAGNLAVNGNMTFRVFENLASTVTISGFTITNGWSSGDHGGGILNHGGLTLSDSIVSASHAGNGGSGGGIFVDGGGTLTVTNSTISGNGACCEQSYGGGIFNGGTLTVIDSTINSNGASSGGGGIASGGQLTVMNSTISGNSSFVLPGGFGGGMTLFSGTAATVTDSTISDNGAITGGGIVNTGNLTISNTTFSGNLADDDGGDIYNDAGTVQIGDTVLNAGMSGGTIFKNSGMVTSLGYNLASDNGGGVLTGPGDQINTDPMLGPLQDNGGPTFTHELLAGSPAIDAGDPNFTPPPSYDQRGAPFHRVVNGRIDVGSFEVQAGSTPTPTATATATPTATPTLTPRPSLTPRPRPTPDPRPTL